MEQLEVYRNIVHAVQNINNVELDRHPQRIIRDKQNPFELFSDKEFKKRFRFCKTNVLFIVNLIGVELVVTGRQHCIPPHLQFSLHCNSLQPVASN